MAGSHYRVVNPDDRDGRPRQAVACAGCGKPLREDQSMRIVCGELTLTARCVDCLNVLMNEYCRETGGFFSLRPADAGPRLHRGGEPGESLTDAMHPVQEVRLH